MKLTSFHLVLALEDANLHIVVVSGGEEKSLLVLVLLDQRHQIHLVVDRVVDEDDLGLPEMRHTLQLGDDLGALLGNLLLGHDATTLLYNTSQGAFLMANTHPGQPLFEIDELTLKKHSNYKFGCKVTTFFANMQVKKKLFSRNQAIMKQFIHIFVLLSVWMGALVLNSCSSKSTTSSASSSVAQLTGFYLSHDSFPQLAKTTFLIKDLLDTGLVYNPDSIAYGVAIDSVKTRLNFYATPSSAVMSMGDTAFALAGNDALNYNLKPAVLKIVSYDGTKTKYYQVDVRAHQVDPDVYIWKRLTNQMGPDLSAPHRLLTRVNAAGKSELYCYVLTLSGVALYRSTDGAAWTNTAVTGLPADCDVESIITNGTDAFCYADGSMVYTSTDGAAWSSTMVSSARAIRTPLFYFRTEQNEELPWFLCEGDELGQWMIAYLRANTLCDYLPVPVESFPVYGFAAIPFRTTSDRQRMLLLGGYSELGEELGCRWNWECVIGREVRMTRYDLELPTFPSVSNAAVVWYDNRLMLLGAMEEDTLSYRGVYASVDEGLHWSLMDTTHCMLPEDFADRMYVQAAVMNQTDIILLGGEKPGVSCSDVYSGRVRSIDWK